MALKGSIQDYEFQKFIESTSRPGNAIPEVAVSASALPSGAATEATLQNVVTELSDFSFDSPSSQYI